MSQEDTATVVAVVVARLDDMREDIADLRRAVEDSSRDKVTRGEWAQRNEHVDTRLQNLGSEINVVRTEVHSRRAPWWSTATVLLAAAAFAWSMLGPVLTR